MRQDLVMVDQDEIVAAAHATCPARADTIAEIADRDRGDQTADEGVVDAPHRRAHVEQRLLQRVAPEQLAPEGAVRRLQLAKALHALRQGEKRDGIAADRAVGTADGAMELQVERGEGRHRDLRHSTHHDRQRLTDGDRRIHVDPAGGGESRNQLELFSDRIEPALDRRYLALDDTRGAVDQQALGRTRGAGQHHDIGDAGNQRQGDEG
jgi:hypothetical protein